MLLSGSFLICSTSPSLFAGNWLPALLSLQVSSHGTVEESCVLLVQCTDSSLAALEEADQAGCRGLCNLHLHDHYNFW